jgi:hypothetical protein
MYIKMQLFTFSKTTLEMYFFTTMAARHKTAGTNKRFVLGIEPGEVHELSGVENRFWL